MPSDVHENAHSGIDVRLSDSRPFPAWPRRQTISHHKYIVVDDREVMVGGMNIGTLFRRYHDLMVYLQGPAAATLGRQFDNDWACALDKSHPRHNARKPIWTTQFQQALPWPNDSAHCGHQRRAANYRDRSSTEPARRA